MRHHLTLLGLCLSLCAIANTLGCEQRSSPAERAPDTALMGVTHTTQTMNKEQESPPKPPSASAPSPATGAIDPSTLPQTQHTRWRVELPTDARPTLRLIGNPHVFEGRTLAPKWALPDDVLLLRAEPSPDAPRDIKLPVREFESLTWHQSIQEVHTPRLFTARAPTTLDATTTQQLDPATGKARAPASLTLAHGEGLELFYSYYNGRCLARVRGSFYELDCPDPAHFSCDQIPPDYMSAPMLPVLHYWWLEVSRGEVRGWVNLETDHLLTNPKRLDLKTGLIKEEQEAAPNDMPIIPAPAP